MVAKSSAVRKQPKLKLGKETLRDLSVRKGKSGNVKGGQGRNKPTLSPST